MSVNSPIVETDTEENCEVRSSSVSGEATSVNSTPGRTNEKKKRCHVFIGPDIKQLSAYVSSFEKALEKTNGLLTDLVEEKRSYNRRLTSLIGEVSRSVDAIRTMLPEHGDDRIKVGARKRPRGNDMVIIVH